MKKALIWNIYIVLASVVLAGCNLSGNSAIVGEWRDGTMTWTFYNDGSFSGKSRNLFTGTPRVVYGNYKIRGKKLIMDSGDGQNSEFTWRKPDNDHLTFGNDAGGYWQCERIR